MPEYCINIHQINKKIGVWLQEARLKAGMHLAQVSQVVLGQTDDTLLVAYEGGRATVPDRTLSQLALHYGVPAQDLSEFLTATRTKID